MQPKLECSVHTAHISNPVGVLSPHCTLASTCKGIHEVGSGAAKHLEERVTDWVLCGTTERGVLQDVGDTSVVRGVGAEPNTEHRE